MLKRVDAILMASGYSRRFLAGDKLLQPFRGQPLAIHTLRLATAMEAFRRVLLVCADDMVAQLASAFAVEVIRNAHPERGQRESIRLGVAASDADGYLFFPCDQPLLDAATVQRVLQAGAEGGIAIPTWQGTPGAPALFSSAFREDLLHLRAGEGGKTVQTEHPGAVRMVPIENPWALMDVDTREDLRRLEEMDGSL